MPDESIRDYITKTEASTIYRRSERSLSRDITNAIKVADESILQNVELRLEDGNRRPGTELTIREIVELRDRGLNPTWLLHTAWLQTTYGRRDEPPPHDARTASQDLFADADPPPITLPDDLAQRAAVLAAQNAALERLNADLKSQTVRLEKELDRRADERREENELQKQNNVLMQQIYNLLSKMQESPGQINLLPPPAPAPRTRRTEEAISVNSHVTAKRKGMVTTRKAIGRKATAKRTEARKSADDVRRQSTAIKKYLPTIDRAVRSLFRK